MGDDPQLERLKAEARLAARAARAEAAQLDPGACLKVMENFPVAPARLDPIAAYWPIGTEMDPRPLMAALAKAGRTIALPRADARDAPVRFLAWDGATLAPDAYGAPAPHASADVVAPMLIIVPLLAFDRTGARLGQGGGVYDRTLRALRPRGIVAVGLAYAAQELDSVPAGPDDQGLDWVVTEREAIRCAEPAAG
ncbi:MAG: 5-formyltetrahydrofolate cyclo-ligase [Alphaproteobacteria bacterium]|nr:5-formyltetrahydrofolate cyclo-ligase [Alphaproteobacteria bacterium]